LTDRQLDRWVAAAAHLAGAGYPAILPGPILSALRARKEAAA
jgi:hypothetical protein